MSRYFLLCMFLALACASAGDTWAQNAAPAVNASLNADRAKSNALTPDLALLANQIEFTVGTGGTFYLRSDALAEAAGV